MAIHITSDSKLAVFRPTTRKELRQLIDKELYKQGPDADLNFIDTSLITDMSWLFYYFDIRNIGIESWDTSNVTTMEGMFSGATKFNCDLSYWDVSKVTNMQAMFMNCYEFNCDLSRWDMSSVRNVNFMLSMCKSFDENNKPNHPGIKLLGSIDKEIVDEMTTTINKSIDNAIASKILGLM
jgi:surface protein